MASRIALALVLCLAPLGASNADTYRWVDDGGKTHYGDSVPDKYKSTAKKVGAEGATNPAQRREAEDRVASDKAKLDAVQKAREAREANGQQPSPATRPPVAAQGDDCQAQMKRYLESLDCFAPYTLSNGATKSEAIGKCEVVTQPTGCLATPGSSERTY